MNIIKPEQFAERLRTLRKKNGYSQAELGRALNISRRAMCYYERESNKLPPADLLIKISEILGISLEELLDLDSNIDGRTVEAKTARKLKHVSELPKNDRDLLFQMLDSLMKKNNLSKVD